MMGPNDRHVHGPAAFWLFFIFFLPTLLRMVCLRAFLFFLIAFVMVFFEATASTGICTMNASNNEAPSRAHQGDAALTRSYWRPCRHHLRQLQKPPSSLAIH